MAVYVRLAMGAEDEYGAYEGCASCAYPMKRSAGFSYGYVEGSGGCPNCSAGRSIYDSENGDWSQVPLGWWNPKVQVNDDGSLAVIRWNTQLGFYPQGAWVSYRSD